MATAFALCVLINAVLLWVFGDRAAPRKVKEYEKGKVLYPAFANRVGLIKPAAFHFNMDALEDNKFINFTDGIAAEETSAAALKAFETYRSNLVAAGIEARVFQNPDPKAVDAIFPDWFFTVRNEDVPEGILFLCPMYNPTR